MNGQPNSKVIGASIIGIALVAGTYVLTNFGETSNSYVVATPSQTTQQAAPIRSAIVVTDEDGNGIEDWRDEFITTEPIILNNAINEEYVPPNTLTGQLGINFVQDIVRANSYGEFGRSNDEVITDTIKSLAVQTSHSIYDTQDVNVFPSESPVDIRNYANTVATTILENSRSVDLDNELLILQDIMNRNDKSRISDLETLAEAYRITREALLQIPVPSILLKEHLDLINTFHAVHNDIVGMSMAFEDPVYSLMRIKRYEDDVLAMSKAFENMYLAFTPYASIFLAEDPAVFFVTFSPSNNVRI